MFAYTEDKLIGLCTFLAATFASKDYHFNMHEIYDTLTKGVINSVFAITVVIITHYIRKYLNKNKNKTT